MWFATEIGSVLQGRQTRGDCWLTLVLMDIPVARPGLTLRMDWGPGITLLFLSRDNSKSLHPDLLNLCVSLSSFWQPLYIAMEGTTSMIV